MLINKTGSRASTQTVNVKFDTLLDDVCVPRAVSCFTAENQLDVGVEEFDGFGPLVGFLGVVLLCHLADLPGTVHLVSESPVFDLIVLVMGMKKRGEGIGYVVRLLTAVLTTEVGVVCWSVGVAVLDPCES
jgi:hypothetical protein